MIRRLRRLLCFFGYHEWSNWQEPDRFYRFRICYCCGDMHEEER